MDIAATLKATIGLKLKEHEVLRPYTALGIGGVADFFYEARLVEELVAAVKAAYEIGIPYFILGGGSQVVVSDYGFPGLVIYNKTSRISFIPEQSQVIVDSGVATNRLVMETASRDMGGIEFLMTVPGTLGGAVYANKGNFGFALGSHVRTVTEFNPPESLKAHTNEWLAPQYLETRLKKSSANKASPPVILTLKLQLQRYRKEEIVRKIGYYQKLAHPGFMLFKNPTGEPSRLSDDPDVINKRASQVLKRLNASNLAIGQIRLDTIDPNYLLNKGKATASGVRELVGQLKTLAAEREGVLLEEAFEYVGKWD